MRSCGASGQVRAVGRSRGGGGLTGSGHGIREDFVRPGMRMQARFSQDGKYYPVTVGFGLPPRLRAALAD
jgi:hypothetical protein